MLYFWPVALLYMPAQLFSRTKEAFDQRSQLRRDDGLIAARGEEQAIDDRFSAWALRVTPCPSAAAAPSCR
jgi:hypothetical protein